MSMNEDEFDKLIRSKYLEDDEEELVWNNAKVWQNTQPKKRHKLVYFKYAASLAFLTGIGVLYVIFSGEKTITNTAVFIPKIQEKILVKNILVEPIRKPQKKEFSPIFEDKTTKIEPFPEKIIQNTTIQSTPETAISAVLEPKSDVVLREETPAELPKSAIQKQATNQVIVLNIPMEENAKSQPKKRVVGRFFQQIGRYSNGEKFDWEAVNIKPKKIWAYFKNSFVADSTTIY